MGTHRKSPVLILSLNLACTDTIASILNGLGVVFNSYLPVVFNVHFDTCPFLAIEIFRSSALISSVLHLLALAFIHYKGIVRPLHYRVRTFFSHHVTRSIHLISAICWGIPLTAFTIYFYSIPCQGFRSSSCDFRFLASKRYRLFILAFFLIPLVIMFFLYAKIFKIIRANQQMRYSSNGVVNYDKVFQSTSSSADQQSNNQNKVNSLATAAAILLVQNEAKSTKSTSTVTTTITTTTTTISPRHVFIFRNYIRANNINHNKTGQSESNSTTTSSSSVPNSIDHNHQQQSVNYNDQDTKQQLLQSSTSLLSLNEKQQLTCSSMKSIKGKQLNNKDSDDNNNLDSNKGSTVINSDNNTEPINNYRHRLISLKDNRSATIGPTKSNTKALITSLLILGTYLLCWLPAVTFLILTCSDGCPYSIFNLPRKLLIIISSICNFLVICKAIVDPFIYIFRTREVKFAIRKIFKSSKGSQSTNHYGNQVNQQSDGRRTFNNRSTISGSTITNGGSTYNN
ncbi:phosphatidylinositol 3-kinase 2-like [Panonychus citri]|uniref:phosphatidylinositol 3-kinase 2-like n=1 Tax=Panonychus citri TaxID=50023 RepID=UPI002307174C|nr:phosphatidylinositol 3-kinase 2-like [Panonychus citri]